MSPRYKSGGRGRTLQSKVVFCLEKAAAASSSPKSGSIKRWYGRALATARVPRVNHGSPCISSAASGGFAEMPGLYLVLAVKHLRGHGRKQRMPRLHERAKLKWFRSGVKAIWQGHLDWQRGNCGSRCLAKPTPDGRSTALVSLPMLSRALHPVHRLGSGQVRRLTADNAIAAGTTVPFVLILDDVPPCLGNPPHPPGRLDASLTGPRLAKQGRKRPLGSKTYGVGLRVFVQESAC